MAIGGIDDQVRAYYGFQGPDIPSSLTEGEKVGYNLINLPQQIKNQKIKDELDRQLQMAQIRRMNSLTDQSQLASINAPMAAAVKAQQDITPEQIASGGWEVGAYNPATNKRPASFNAVPLKPMEEEILKGISNNAPLVREDQPMVDEQGQMRPSQRTVNPSLPGVLMHPAAAESFDRDQLQKAIEGKLSEKKGEAQIKSSFAKPTTYFDPKDTDFKPITIQPGQPVPEGLVPWSKPSGNKNEPVSPETVQGMLDYFKRSGQIPPFGFAGQNLRSSFFAALAQDPDVTGDALTAKTVRTGLGAAYRNQQTLYQATKTAINTLDKQLELAQQYSGKVDRFGSPFFNKYLLWTKGQFAGDADTKAYESIVKTASNEFAKILSGSPASIAGVTVSSSKDAENILNASLNEEQFNQIIGLMKREAGYRKTSYEDTIREIDTSLKHIGNESRPAPAPAPAAAAPNARPSFNTAQEAELAVKNGTLKPNEGDIILIAGKPHAWKP